MKLRDLPKVALDVVYPRHCLFCASILAREENRSLCEACWDRLPFIKSPFCPRCGVPFKSEYALQWSPDHLCRDCRQLKQRFDTARSVGRYESPLRELILAFKLRGRLTAGGDCSFLMEQHAGRLMERRRLDLVLNVPLHRWRLLRREFDQSALLARAAADALGIPVATHLLTRVVNTQSQTDVKDRRRNVRKAFSAENTEELKGKSVLLVDDVLTSSATVDECARTLKKGGAAEVHVLTLARAVW